MAARCTHAAWYTGMVKHSVFHAKEMVDVEWRRPRLHCACRVLKIAKNVYVSKEVQKINPKEIAWFKGLSERERERIKYFNWQILLLMSFRGEPVCPHGRTDAVMVQDTIANSVTPLVSPTCETRGGVAPRFMKNPLENVQLLAFFLAHFLTQEE